MSDDHPNSPESPASTESAGAAQATRNSLEFDTLYSRITLLAATLAGLVLLAIVAFWRHAVSDGAALMLALIMLALFLVVGGFVRYRCRITLRSFLITVTVFSVILALVARFAMQVRETQMAIRELQDGGASISFDMEASNEWQQTPSGLPMPPWLIKTFGEAAFSKVSYAAFYQTKVDKEKVQRVIKYCPSVHNLSFQTADLEHGALKGIGRLQHLQYLDISNTDANNQDLADAVEGATSLSNISMRSTKVDGKGLKALRQIPNLKSVWLDGVAASDEGLQNLGRQSQMNVLLAMNGKGLTSKGIAGLAERMPNLQHLTLSGNWGINSDIADEVIKFPRIGYLYLNSTNVDDEFLDAIGESPLKSLDVSGTRVTWLGLKRFRKRNPECRLTHSVKPPPGEQLDPQTP